MLEKGAPMPISSMVGEILDGCDQLARSAAAVRHCHQHYLDALGSRDLAELSPWALAGFGHLAWDSYVPDLEGTLPDGLRVGSLHGGAVPALAPFRGHGHLVIEAGSGGLLQALALRLATATRPGTVRFALADPVGQGRHLSALLRLPAHLRVGTGVAASPEEIEHLLTALTRHVVDVTQTRLTNVYESVEEYNAATTGGTVPYHVLVLAGFPADVSDRAAELLTRLARNGPRAGLYIVATAAARRPQARPGQAGQPGQLPRSTVLTADADGYLSWDDPDFGHCVAEPDQMPPAARANPWLDTVGAASSRANPLWGHGRRGARRARPCPAVRTDRCYRTLHLDRRHHRRPGCADRRRQQGRAAAVHAGRPRRAPRPGRRGRPDGQDQPAARADLPALPALPARGAGAVPARLQGSRVRRLPHRTAAACQGGDVPHGPGVRPEHAAPLPRRDQPPGEALPGSPRHGPDRLPARDRPGHAPRAGDHG